VTVVGHLDLGVVDDGVALERPVDAVRNIAGIGSDEIATRFSIKSTPSRRPTTNPAASRWNGCGRGRAVARGRRALSASPILRDDAVVVEASRHACRAGCR
jgi:hypothetical protein